MTGTRRSRFQWGFKSATITIFLLALWAELFAWLLGGTREAEGQAALLYGGGFFLCVLPLIAAAVYAWPVVFAFFRSVKVGVVNLVFIGLASIAGVLFYQEDPNFPIAAESAAGDLVEVSPQRLQHFEEFRKAHAHFTYKFLHGTSGWLYHALPGTPGDCVLDQRAEANRQKLATLEANMEELGILERFGEEYAVALTSKSETGLRVQAENAEIKLLEHRWNDGWWSLFHYADRLDFVRVYKSDWFASFWLVLLFGVVSNTFRGGWRRLLRPRKWGFVMSHLGVILLVLGAFWGWATEKRGILNLNIGRSSDRFVSYAREIEPFTPRNLFNQDAGLPFQVRLDAFRADYHDILNVVYASRDDDGRLDYEFPDLAPPKFRAYEGQTLYFDYGAGDPAFLGESRDSSKVPHLRVEVLEYVPQADLQPVLSPSAPGDPFGQPVAQLAILGPDGAPVLEQILSGPESAPLNHPMTGARIRFHAVESREQALAWLREPVPDNYGRLLQMDPSRQSVLARHGVAPGSQLAFDAGEQRFEVEVLQALPAPRLRQEEDGTWVHVPGAVPVERQEPRNPALLVRITNPEGEQEERWIFQSGFHDMGAQFTELDLSFEWDSWSSPAASRHLLFLAGEGAAAQLFAGAPGDPDSLRQLAAGEALELSDGYRLVVPAFESAGDVDLNIVPVEGADFFHPAPGAVRVRVTTPDGPREMVMSTDLDGHRVEYTGPGGQPRLLKLMFMEDTNDMPLEWQSKLSFYRAARGADGQVHHHGQPDDSGHIRVNDYEVFDGYRFFQTNWDKGDPTYSGIGIVFDPGIEVVLLGLYLVTFGVIIVFVVNPLVTKRHRGI